MDKLQQIFHYLITPRGTQEYKNKIDPKTKLSVSQDQKCCLCNQLYKEHHRLQFKYPHPYEINPLSQYFLPDNANILMFDENPFIL